MLRCGGVCLRRHLGRERLYLSTTILNHTAQTTDDSTRVIPIKLTPDLTSSTQDPNTSASEALVTGGLGFTPHDPPDQETVEQPLYETHVRTNLFQRTILTCGSAVSAILDPRRHDMVAVLGETTGHTALTRLHTLMSDDSEGRRILVDKPRINTSTIDLDALRKLPDDSLGRTYINFLEVNDVTPDSRLPVQFVDDPELAYVMQRYREGHDLFHTVLGMPTNMLGEVAVKWVEALQTGLPMCYGAAVFGPLRFRPKQRQKYLSVYLPWALRVGRTGRLLMNVYFEERWEQSIHEVRAEFGIEPPPDV
ncbi:Ubiquinone biosynthesis protein COQ4, mitochondrial [Chionoecetes opilio]|uniref:Ubiquinone biosynthesis protein COQ4 homolog, mitochondrial n=1 Tax=Chionoecetes opilio TaxID=41210 RepID=A0A8J4YD30_CHIOP|nr:Ubiquinone biosynthesis protein COQ4, mitochondrial [Chionoecetes opilio]